MFYSVDLFSWQHLSSCTYLNEDFVYTAAWKHGLYTEPFCLVDLLCEVYCLLWNGLSDWLDLWLVTDTTHCAVYFLVFAPVVRVKLLKCGCGVCYCWETCSILFCSLAILDLRAGHTMDVLSPFISVILIDSSTGSHVHVVMLSIQAVRGLPRLRAPGIDGYAQK